jgi:hypothetical protein
MMKGRIVIATTKRLWLIGRPARIKVPVRRRITVIGR